MHQDVEMCAIEGLQGWRLMGLRSLIVEGLILAAFRVCRAWGCMASGWGSLGLLGESSGSRC